MKCPTPISIRDKSDKNPKNRASKRIEVPCGRCGACRQARRYQWAFRLKEELKDSKNAYFITLTYNDENLPEYIDYDSGEIKSNLCKKDLQDFIKRLREKQYRKTRQRTFRYYAVGEYGTKTDRAHYHLIGFNIDRDTCYQIPGIWGKGNCHIGQVNDASILYVAKYHVNRNMESESERTKEFATMSKRPAIGHGYLKRNTTWHQENMNTYVYQNGFKKAMPRYYKEKIFDDLNKEQLKNEMETTLPLLEEKKHEKLRKLGFNEPDRELHKRVIHHAQKYKHKINDNNTF